MQRAAQAIRRHDDPTAHGQHIYAYCNVRTRQVVYSLTRSLDSFQSLKQLPDIGANRTPPKIRKDVWKPLYTLSLPPADSFPNGRREHHQGLDVFRQLREFRKLHETNWTPSTELSRNRTNEEIEKLQRRIDERGGAKKETPYDLIKRQKKKMRQAIIMNQKANSIADLAAVLIKQQGTRREHVRERRRERAAAIKTILKYVDDVKNRGALEVIEAEIDEARLLLKQNSAKFAADPQGNLRDGERHTPNRAIRRHIAELNVKRQRLTRAMQHLGGGIEKRVRESRIYLNRLREDADSTKSQIQELNEQLEGLEVQLEEQASEAQVSMTEIRDREQLIKEIKADGDTATLTEQLAQLDASKTKEEELQGTIKSLETQISLTNHQIVQLTADLEPSKMVNRLERAFGPSFTEVQSENTSASEMESESARAVDEESTTTGSANKDLPEIIDRTTPEASAKARRIWNEITDRPDSVREAVQHLFTTKGLSLHWDSSFLEEDFDLSPNDDSTDYELPAWHALLPPTRKLFPEVALKNSKYAPKPEHPIFSLEGARVQWADFLDAEYAAEWPAAVVHEPMGLVRHTAKNPRFMPKMTVLDVNEHITRRKAEREARGQGLESNVVEVEDELSEEDIDDLPDEERLTRERLDYEKKTQTLKIAEAEDRQAAKAQSKAVVDNIAAQAAERMQQANEYLKRPTKWAKLAAVAEKVREAEAAAIRSAEAAARAMEEEQTEGRGGRGPPGRYRGVEDIDDFVAADGARY